MKRANMLIIIGLAAILASCGYIFGGASVVDRGWETPNTNGVVTETKTVTSTNWITVNHTYPGNITETVTVNHTLTKTFTNMLPPFTVTETGILTIRETVYKTVPAFENNTAWSINRHLLDRLNTARELRGLEPLGRNRDLESMAEVNKIAAWTGQTTQIFTLTSYTLIRDLDECWRGDLHVAETILAKLGEDYDYVIYTSTTHGIGIHVDVDLYKIYVRCVFVGA